jgi:hypothetical protein
METLAGHALPHGSGSRYAIVSSIARREAETVGVAREVGLML